MSKRKIIKVNDELHMFDSDSFKIYKINELVMKVLSMHESGLSTEAISSQLSIRQNEVNSLLKSFDQEAIKRKSDTYDTKFKGAFLLISQDCNLRCKYCYADFGRYGSKSKMMSTKTAQKAVDFIINYEPNIEFIQFFGGEPSMNEDCIYYVVEYLKSLKDKGKISQVPAFTMVTNLVEMSDKLLEFIKENQFGITVSVDGDEEIHDFLRIDQQGRSTLKRIDSNYQRLLKAGVKPLIEATFTSYHQERVSLPSLIKFLDGKYTNQGIHVSNVCVSKDHNLGVKNREKALQDKKQAINLYFESMVTDSPIYFAECDEMIETIIEKDLNSARHFVCKEAPGINQFTINADGDVYACYALSNRKSMYLSSIYNENYDQIIEGKKHFMKINKTDRKCNSCWAKHMCSVCLAGEVLAGYEYGTVQEQTCENIKVTLEYMLQKYIEVQKNPEKSERFKHNFLQRGDIS